MTAQITCLLIALIGGSAGIGILAVELDTLTALQPGEQRREDRREGAETFNHRKWM